MASDCKVKNLEALKREIRALLISSKHGCTPQQLQDDYLQVMGESIPYHYLGFTNFLTFIYSIPDVVSVCRSRNNIVLYGVADKKTQKIKDLVSKQRDKKGAGCTSTAPRMNMVTSTHKPTPKEPAVPTEFKLRLKELMLSHPNGIPLKFFNEAFAKRFCHYIAHRNYGFDSIESMIHAVPDVLEIHKDTTRNIEMVKRVFPLETSRRSRGSGSQKEGGTWKTVQQQQRSINWYYVDHERQDDPVFTKPPEQDHTATLSLNTLELSPQMKKKLLEPTKPSDRPKKKPVPWILAGKIKNLLLANKMGIWVSRFLVEYRVRINMNVWVKRDCLAVSCIGQY